VRVRLRQEGRGNVDAQRRRAVGDGAAGRAVAREQPRPHGRVVEEGLHRARQRHGVAGGIGGWGRGKRWPRCWGGVRRGTPPAVGGQGGGGNRRRGGREQEERIDGGGRGGGESTTTGTVSARRRADGGQPAGRDGGPG